MPALLDVQRRFGAALLGGADAPPPIEIRGGAVGAAARIGIYRNNVIGNLTGALRLNFPAVERLVGTAFFAAACARFIAASPPAGADLYEYGDSFPAFLARFEPAQGLAYLSDVARLEWAVTRALHAPFAPAIDMTALSTIPLDALAELRFTAHPSLSLLALAHPARAIWEAVLTEDPDARAAALGAIDPDAGGETLAVHQGADGLDVTVLAEDGFALAQALTAGGALGEALERTAPEQAASLLGVFLAQGYLGGVRVPSATTPIAEGMAP